MYFRVLLEMVLTFKSMDEILMWNIQMKASELYFPLFFCIESFEQLRLDEIIVEFLKD